MNEEIQVITLTESEAKDRVLKYLLERWVEDGKQSRRYFHSETIRTNVFPDVHLEKIEYLIERILAFDSKLLKYVDGVGNSRYRVCANSFTNDFINIQGGFEKVYQDEQKRLSERDELTKLDTEIKRLQKSELEHKTTIRDQEQRIRNLTEALHWWNFAQAYWKPISFLVILILTIGGLGEKYLNMITHPIQVLLDLLPK